MLATRHIAPARVGEVSPLTQAWGTKSFSQAGSWCGSRERPRGSSGAGGRRTLGFTILLAVGRAARGPVRGQLVMMEDHCRGRRPIPSPPSIDVFPPPTPGTIASLLVKPCLAHRLPGQLVRLPQPCSQMTVVQSGPRLALLLWHRGGPNTRSTGCTAPFLNLVNCCTAVWYGSNKPGRFTSLGKLCLPNPRFTDVEN